MNNFLRYERNDSLEAGLYINNILVKIKLIIISLSRECILLEVMGSHFSYYYFFLQKKDGIPIITDYGLPGVAIGGLI